MTIQKKKILESVDFIKSKIPLRKVNIALITYKNPLFLKKFKVIQSVNLDNSNRLVNNHELISAVLSNKNIIIINGRYNYYDGYSMRDIAHPVYVLKELGVKRIILIDEVGHLNPQFQSGEVALIYDHINMMGDNPLIGENDNTIGIRFPDMSNSYDSVLYSKAESLFIKEGFKFCPSVYLGIQGPETETAAECKFYRDIGCDILGYSLTPENLAVIHSGLKCLAFGMISRELVADRLEEITSEQKIKNRQNAEKKFSTIIENLIKII